MIDNIIFSLNATMPLFIMMVTGLILRNTGLLDDKASQSLNRLVFVVFLPALLFTDMAEQDFFSVWDGKFVLFCAVSTVLSILISLLMSGCCAKKDERGEFIQASYRSAAATLGISYMTNIYSSSQMISLMILGSVPIYNIAACIVLETLSPEKHNGKGLFRKTVIGILKNPIILGIVAGFLWSFFSLPTPRIFMKSMDYLGRTASPLALIALGASWRINDLGNNIKSVAIVCFNKLFLFTAIFLPFAVKLGFRDEKLVSALIMLGSAVTSSSYIMARNMGHKGEISSSAVMLTTLLASFSLSFWLFLIKTLGYI